MKEKYPRRSFQNLQLLDSLSFVHSLMKSRAPLRCYVFEYIYYYAFVFRMDIGKNNSLMTQFFVNELNSINL